jgi:hypothetical protein
MSSEARVAPPSYPRAPRRKRCPLSVIEIIIVLVIIVHLSIFKAIVGRDTESRLRPSYKRPDPLLATTGIGFPRHRAYLPGMPSKKKRTAAKLRNWRVSILRQRAEYLGVMQAADERAAQAAAIAAFELDEHCRKRIVVRAEE